MDLRLLVAGVREGLGIGSRQAVAGTPRLFDRFPPLAAELQDLGAVHQAGAGGRDELGLLLAPVGEGRGPLAGAVEGVDLLADHDGAALEVARHLRGARRRIRRTGPFPGLLGHAVTVADGRPAPGRP
jgi:hypothetical protein